MFSKSFPSFPVNRRELLTAKVVFTKFITTPEAQNYVNSHKAMLDILKKHFKELLANGFPEKKDESNHVELYFSNGRDKVECNTVFETYSEQNLIAYMQGKLEDRVVVVKHLLEMV